jgi:hypothetical protein
MTSAARELVVRTRRNAYRYFAGSPQPYLILRDVRARSDVDEVVLGIRVKRISPREVEEGFVDAFEIAFGQNTETS